MTLGESGLGIGVGTSMPMNLTVSGVVGIGTTSPAVPLDIQMNGSTPVVAMRANNNVDLMWFRNGSSGYAWDFSNRGTIASPVDSLYLFGEGGGDIVQIWTQDGNVGFGTTSPSGRIDSETGGANLWAGMFNYNGGNFTGAYGVWAYGTTVGVSGNTVNSQGVQGNALGTGNGVLGTSTSGWGGNFQGAYGVYAQDSSGYWTELGNGGWGVLTNGSIYIGYGTNNAQLCLNGSCTTSLPQGTFGGIFSNYGSGEGGACLIANPWTGNCTCPSWAPNQNGTVMSSVPPATWIHQCWG